MDFSIAMSQLASRLEDSAHKKFTELFLKDALVNAEIELTGYIHKSYLTELETKELTKTATSGVYSLSSLSNNVLGGAQGIMKVKISGGRWCTRQEFDDVKVLESHYHEGTYTNPVYYVVGDTINVDNGQTNPIIDVYYRKEPSPKYFPFVTSEDVQSPVVNKFGGATGQGLNTTNDYYNGAVVYLIEKETYHVITDYVGADLVFSISPNAAAAIEEGETWYFITHSFDQLNLDSVNFDLNITLHNIILDLAEANCWLMDAKGDRAKLATDKAFTHINALNEKVEKAEGIGTEGNKK